MFKLSITLIIFSYENVFLFWKDVKDTILAKNKEQLHFNLGPNSYEY